ncbi:MAG: type II secretion system minor pseudopilin GspH [Gammaproteobacteria bacterium]
MAVESKRRGEAGFTLIEILAVVIIVGIVTGIAVISLKALDGRSDQGQAAERLAGLIQLASEDARMENIQYGLRVEPHQYEFMQFNGRAWVTISNDPVLATRSVPGGLTLSVQTQNQVMLPVASTAPGSAAVAASAAAADTDTGGRDAVTPQIAILSTGEMTPFTLSLASSAGETYVLRGTGNGQIHVDTPAANAPAPATY